MTEGARKADPAARTAAQPTRRTPRLRTANREPGEPLMRGAVLLLNAIMRATTKHVWVGRERIPAQGGLIIVANHISNADPLVLGQFLAYAGRWPRYLAKSSLFGVPVLGRFLHGVGQIPVQRNSRAATDALGAAVRAVEAGRTVVIYPEGTITGDADRWPMVGKTGAARVALRTGCPVVPVGQWGAQLIMDGARVHAPRVWPAATVEVLAGEPVPLDDLRALPMTATVLNQATERMMAAITVLVEELRGEAAPAHRHDPRTDALPSAPEVAPTDGGSV